MVMVLSLLPEMAIHVHAAYEDGMECPGCGEYHWDENCCGNCGACTRECDDDCYEETHCINDCGACRADGNFACDCGYCYTCAKQEEPEKHCDYCGKEDDGGICSECGLCEICAEHCEHGYCKYANDFGGNCDCVPCPHDEKSTYQSNRQGHWKVCSDCGLLVDRAAHTEGTPVLNSAESTADVDVYNLPCETCGYVMANVNSPEGEVPPHVHRYDANGYCQVCGAKSDGKPYMEIP